MSVPPPMEVAAPLDPPLDPSLVAPMVESARRAFRRAARVTFVEPVLVFALCTSVEARAFNGGSGAWVGVVWAFGTIAYLVRWAVATCFGLAALAELLDAAGRPSWMVRASGPCHVAAIALCVYVLLTPAYGAWNQALGRPALAERLPQPDGGLTMVVVTGLLTAGTALLAVGFSVHSRAIGAAPGRRATLGPAALNQALAALTVAPAVVAAVSLAERGLTEDGPALLYIGAAGLMFLVFPVVQGAAWLAARAELTTPAPARTP